MREENHKPKVLVIYGHPRSDSLSYALGENFEEGARAAGAEVRRLLLAEMEFDLNVHKKSPRHQSFEDDLRQARHLIQWADHLAFVYPTWWGTVPALLKGFLDRIFTSGFAFREIEGGTGYEPLLEGKSARLITTRDTPGFVYRWIYRAPGHNAMKRATLGFAGIQPVHISSFGPVRDSTRNQRKKWLRSTWEAGHALQNGHVSSWNRARYRIAAWLKALRLQFYPMTWIAYTAGAAAAPVDDVFTSAAFWLGLLFLFFLEAATVFSNDYFDYESDRQNKFFSPFTGGSRVLISNDLGFEDLRKGISVTLLLAVASLAVLLVWAVGDQVAMFVHAIALSVLALGYTIPPLTFSHRGVGEFVVGVTHSLGAILSGYLFLGGAWNDPLPWILSAPLFLSILPAILLAGMPDYHADRNAGKKTLVVSLGRPYALYLAMAITVAAAITASAADALQLAAGVFDGITPFVLLHGAVLTLMLYQYAQRIEHVNRIDSLIAVALSYILWFGLIPLINLL